MTHFNFNGTEIKVSASFKGEVSNVWGDGMKHFKFIITIVANDKKTSFTYYDSFANWQKNKQSLESGDLKSALDCFFSDASCYENATDLADFLCEFGYGDSAESLRKGIKAFEGCKRHYQSVVRVFGSDWYDIANAINESY